MSERQIESARDIVCWPVDFAFIHDGSHITSHLPFWDIHFYRYMSFLCISASVWTTWAQHTTALTPISRALSQRSLSFSYAPKSLSTFSISFRYKIYVYMYLSYKIWVRGDVCVCMWAWMWFICISHFATDNPIMKLFFWLLIPIWYWVSLPFRRIPRDEKELVDIGQRINTIFYPHSA